MIDKFNIKTKTKLREEIKYEFDNSKIQVSVHKIISKDNRPNEDQKYEDYYKIFWFTVGTIKRNTDAYNRLQRLTSKRNPL